MLDVVLDTDDTAWAGVRACEREPGTRHPGVHRVPKAGMELWVSSVDSTVTSQSRAHRARRSFTPGPRTTHLTGATRKIVPFASSLTSSAPSRATATPTGRPHTVVLSITKPVMKSSYSPVGLPPFMRTRITL